MTPDTSEANRNALLRLLGTAERLNADFTADVNAVLSPVVAEVISESDILLTEVVESFGWDGQHFARPVNCQAFICRLKALMFDGLELKGQGSYATVYKARNRINEEIVTLKKLKLQRTEDGVPAQAIREISMLAELDHPHVVSLLDVLWDESRLYMILEYLDVDLRQHLDMNAGASHPDNVRRYMFQILQGLEYAHARGILHRDLKPQNILVDQTLNLCKLADFGLARSFIPPVRPYTHEVVTLLYRPPEILLGSQLYSTPIDIWSAGCIFAELANGRPVFPGDSEVGQIFSIFSKLGTPNEATWPGVTQLPDWQPLFPQWTPQDLQEVCPTLDPLGVDLLRQLLAYDPNQRITARRAVEHPYFQGLQPYFSPGTPAADCGERPPAAGAASSHVEQMDSIATDEAELPTATSGYDMEA